MAPSLKLYYFQAPGRGEATRVMLDIAGVPYEDVAFGREQWPELKPKMPFGQVPVLEVDGTMLAQSGAIERYAARLANLYPEDAWEVAKVEELVSFVQEVGDVLRPTWAIQDLEARIKARQELVAGPMKLKLEKLAELLGKAGGDFFVGGKLTYADVVVYSALSNFISGFVDGIPKDLLDSHPALKAHHNRVASVPAVAKRYENAEGLRLAFKPLS